MWKHERHANRSIEVIPIKGGKAALTPDKQRLITNIETISPGRPEPLTIMLGIDVMSKTRTPRR
jgi:hypothetical protein